MMFGLERFSSANLIISETEICGNPEQIEATFLDPAQPSIAKLQGVLKRNVPSSSRKRLPEPAQQRRVEPPVKRPRARRVLID